MKNLPFKIGLFLVLSAIIALFCGLIFFVAQQNYRFSANDPQIQISEDMASLLSQGVDPNSVLPRSNKTDISQSLVWFVIIYDEAGGVKVSSATLDGQTPDLPKGVLDFTKENGQNRVTWQPKQGVRIAAVVTKYDGGYVLVGRSLQEVEMRISSLAKKIIAGWMLIEAITLLGIWVFINKPR